MAFSDFRKHGLGKRISKMKGDEVKAFFFFPMRKATAIANVDLAVTWLHGAVELCGGKFVRHGGFYSCCANADGDVRVTAGREAGATLGARNC